ncbi:phage terminase large subunit family protein [Escherichia coli]|nr:phage terminase large subunit family protein [Escherichia coli]
MGFSSARNLGRDISAGFSPPRRMPISEAVKKFMRVPKGAGNSVPWDPELTPYIIEPMNCLASREYDAVIFVGPARTGKTIGLIDGWIVYTIVCDPSDMLVVQMTEDKAREHSKKRLDRTFRSSAAVKKRMSPRRNDNNVHDKTFRDGSFLKIGWPSVNIMSSSDYRFVALTDYDRFPENIDSEGDGFSLASKRTTTFMSAGMTLVESSPGRDICDSKWRRKSPHEAPPTTGILSLYNRGDRRRWYWPCPHCGEYFQPAMDAMTGYPEDWDVLLTDVFHKSWPLASDPSQQMRLMAMAVDSGGEDGVTDNAYKFWRRCRRDGLGKRIYLFKGDSIRRAKLITRTFPDNTGRTGRRAQAAGDVPLWLLQTDALKDRVNNALWRDSPGPGYVHFPDWLGSWFYDELTYEERSSDGKWSKPGRGANEAFDLMVYAEALVILHGYEKIRWPDAPEWASRETWLECVPDSTEPSPSPEPVSTPVKKQKRKKTVTDDVNPWLTSGGWL